MNDSGTQWVTGKVGEWLQGTDENGDPIVFPFTTTSSPFRTLTSIERATNLSIAAEPQSISSKPKTELAVTELAATRWLATDCNNPTTTRDSPPPRRRPGSRTVGNVSGLFSGKHHPSPHFCEGQQF